MARRVETLAAMAVDAIAALVLKVHQIGLDGAGLIPFRLGQDDPQPLVGHVLSAIANAERLGGLDAEQEPAIGGTQHTDRSARGLELSRLGDHRLDTVR